MSDRILVQSDPFDNSVNVQINTFAIPVKSSNFSVTGITRSQDKMGTHQYSSCSIKMPHCRNMIPLHANLNSDDCDSDPKSRITIICSSGPLKLNQIPSKSYEYSWSLR
ncbi:hypothetical protein VNO77_09499 [Canavalia gladiata]|uniref:Uncharacterized protein n=1 Tax=Canavalia gladiata TaxID=3824 RepID=A0AAN9MAU8_CANGL